MNLAQFNEKVKKVENAQRLALKEYLGFKNAVGEINHYRRSVIHSNSDSGTLAIRKLEGIIVSAQNLVNQAKEMQGALD